MLDKRSQISQVECEITKTDSSDHNLYMVGKELNGETLTRTNGNTVDYSYTYQYDMLSQLTDATITNIGGNDWAGASGGETFSLDWDLNGNMKDLPYSGVTGLTYNRDNKLRSGQKQARYFYLHDRLGSVRQHKHPIRVGISEEDSTYESWRVA